MSFRNYIQDEIEKGRMCGPFSEEEPPCDLFQVNPCGLMEKKGTNPKTFRVISHLSAPFGLSVNDRIYRLEFVMKYENVNHAVRWINKYRKGCILSKVDIKNAYRILPVDSVDQDLQGIKLGNDIYFDKALAFGNRASGGIFCRFADVITWITMQQSIGSIIHYVDDFLIISKSDGQRELRQFLRILNILKIPYKESKLEGPSTCIIFLGVQIDTVTMSISVLPQKRQKIRGLLNDWEIRKWCIKNDLQSHVGSLIWLCQVLPQGRPFVQQFIKAQKAVTNPRHHVRITKPMTADIKWWAEIIE